MIINTFFVFPFLALAIVISFLTCLYSLPFFFFRRYALQIKMKPLVNHYSLCLSPHHHQPYILPVSPLFDQSFRLWGRGKTSKACDSVQSLPWGSLSSLITSSRLILISFSMFLTFETTKVYSIRQYAWRTPYFSFYLG